MAADKYGLVGSSSCVHKEKINFFDRLPDEVLQHIFCHLPLLDVLLNSNRVCTRWNNIISNPKFMKWKKRYHKMKKGVGDVLCEVKEVMKTNKMTLPSTYISGLIRYVYSKHVLPRKYYSHFILLLLFRVMMLFTLWSELSRVLYSVATVKIKAPKGIVANLFRSQWGTSPSLQLFYGGDFAWQPFPQQNWIFLLIFVQFIVNLMSEV